MRRSIFALIAISVSLLIESAYAQVIYTTTSYDSSDRVKCTSNPYRDRETGSTCREYDALGRVTKVANPDGTYVLTEYSGNWITITDETGRKRKSRYDALGRLVEVVEPNETTGVFAYSTTYGYDGLSNLTSVAQTGDAGLGQPRNRTFQYDSLSELRSAANPESGTINYDYDDDGNLLAKTDARGIRTSYQYDSIHRLLQKTYSDNTAGAYFMYDVSSLYGVTIRNPIGRLTKADRPDTTLEPGCIGTINSYDAMGRITDQYQWTPQNCSHGSWHVSYKYDLAGDLTSYTNGKDVTITLSVDNAGRVAAINSSWSDITHPQTLATDITYTASGALNELTYGNGLKEARQYDSRLRPSEIRVFDPAESSELVGKLKFSYTFAENGDVVRWKGEGSYTPTFDRQYVYDHLNRLEQMTSDACSLRWNYDPWGNRRGQEITGGTCFAAENLAFDAKNRITGKLYDAAGNLIQDYGVVYQYDAENRLTGTNTGIGFRYDAFGRRVQKVSSNGTTNYIYGADGEVVTETDETDKWRIGYVRLNGGLFAQYSDNSAYFVTRDHLGSSRLLTKPDKTLRDVMDYQPFGEQNLGASYTKAKFNGKEHDSETGLDYFGARYFGSNMGRFSSADDGSDQDPDDPQSWNLYSYVRNSPLSNTDTTGRTCQTNSRDGSIYDDNDGKGCAQIDVDNATHTTPYVVRDTDDDISYQLSAAVADRTSLQNIAEYAQKGMTYAGIALGVGEVATAVSGARAAGQLATARTLANSIPGMAGLPAASRAALQAAANSGGETVTVVTNLTRAPVAGRGLSVAVGDGAEALAGAARSGGQTFTAQIPKALIDALKNSGLARESVTNMGGVAAREIRFAPQATEFILKFFKL